MTMSGKSGRAAMVAAVCCGLLTASSAHAEHKVAVQSGPWASTSTWGGPAPVRAKDTVGIPAGLTVTIPSGSDVVLRLAAGSGQVDVAGSLIVQGSANFAVLQVAAGGAVDIDGAGSLRVDTTFSSRGSVRNSGLLFSSAYQFTAFGSITNERGGVLENYGMMAFGTTGAAINRGTILNRSSLNLSSALENYGAIDNRASLDVRAELWNVAGATLDNNRYLGTEPSGVIRNDGTLRSEPSIYNKGKIVNGCSGTFVGAAPHYNAPQRVCAAQAPVPTWQKISAPTAWNTVSAGSASALSGTGDVEADGQRYVLEGTGNKATYSRLADLTPVAMVQTSLGADGTLWGVKADQSIWRLQSGSWSTAPGSLKQVSVASVNNVWGVNSVDSVFQWNGRSWTRMPGTLTQVSVARDGSVWGITRASEIMQWTGAGWQQVPGAAVQVAVASATLAYVVNGGGTVYRWTGSAWSVENTPSKVRAIAAAPDGTLFIIGSDGALYRK